MAPPDDQWPCGEGDDASEDTCMRPDGWTPEETPWCGSCTPVKRTKQRAIAQGGKARPADMLADVDATAPGIFCHSLPQRGLHTVLRPTPRYAR